VRAELAKHANAPVGFAKGDEVLAEQPEPDRGAIRVRQLFGQQRWHPMAAHEAAHRGLALDPAEGLVFFSGQHAYSPINRLAY
jgi:hypothetical protein